MITVIKCDLCKDFEANPNLKSNLVTYICEDCYDRTKNSRMRKWLWPEIDKISDKLYLGNEDAGQDLEVLKANKITHILVAGSCLSQPFPEQFTYKQFQIDDYFSQNIKQFFQESIDFINSGNVVFVHCAAGVSRSSTIVIAYLMKQNKMTFEEAHDFVLQKRPCICPNDGFMLQLKEYEKELKEQAV